MQCALDRRACENRIAAAHRKAQTGQISLAMMNAYNRDRREQKRQRKTHVVAVVESAQQHGEEHQTKDQAAARWQDIDAALVQLYKVAIGSLASLRPPLYVALQESREPAPAAWPGHNLNPIRVPGRIPAPAVPDP